MSILLSNPAIRTPWAGGRRILSACVRAALAGLALATLSACAGDDPAAGLTPPNPSVPQVPDTAFPSVGAPAAERAPALTPEAQQKLQKDLERLARTQGK
ncbi:hypothetical protein ACI7BZ_17615 [Xanthobacter sp. AM11]|uniref:hypothetical protein n=1 Tax=Xanthobacter sp. AM11 TaxID=3380643 RepID=UPI0039BFAE92